MTSAFARATAVSGSGGGGYDAPVDAGWSIGGRPNGGYLLGIAARAGLAALGAPDLIAISGNFLRPPEGGPAVVRTEVLKQGRTLGTARASLQQHGAAILDTTVGAGTLADGPPQWAGARPPALPTVEECVGRDSDFPGGVRVEMLDHVEIRLDPVCAHAFEGRPSGAAEMRGYVRLRDGAEPDPVFLPLAADALPPTVFNLGLLGWAPTVQMTVLVRGRPAPGWLVVDARSRWVADGWFDEEADVWDSTGRLVAQSRQLARVGIAAR